MTSRSLPAFKPSSERDLVNIDVLFSKNISIWTLSPRKDLLSSNAENKTKGNKRKVQLARNLQIGEDALLFYCSQILCGD